MAANEIILQLDDAADLSITEGAPATLIECHTEAAAELVLHANDSVFAFEMVELMRGPQGEEGQQGIQGIKGDIGGTFAHQQPTTAAMWTVNHNLGFRPSVKALTVGGVEMVAEVIHASANQVLIYFDAPVAGIATCS